MIFFLFFKTLFASFKLIVGIFFPSRSLTPEISVSNIIFSAFRDAGDDDVGSVAFTPSGTVQATNLTATNFIGFAQQTVSDNEDVKVATTGQTDNNQSSLTPATQLYVQGDGTLSTTAGTPSVLGGTALSSTKILIKS